jgi:actin-related protein
MFDRTSQCPIDIRKQLASNIILTGSVSSLVGFETRLLAELKTALAKAPHAKIAHLNPLLRISIGPFTNNTVGWVGGSLYAASVK